jgi:SRSO17 transposase
VSLSVATSTQHLPIDFELFLPESWAGDAERRKKAKVPEELTFKTKHDLALAMIERAARDGIPGDILLADSFYGHARPFREAVRLMGFDYGVAIYASDRMHMLDAQGGRSALQSAKDIALGLGSEAFRTYQWREGTNGWLRSRFAFRRVQVADEAGLASPPEWLMIEWPEHASEPTKFLLTTLRKRMPKKAIVRLVMERYRTEQVYEEMKGELGLDHFEGRSYRGWHHHVSVALCCYAFVVAERARHFPPSERRQDSARPLERAA